MEHLEYQREETQQEAEQIEFLISSLEKTKDSLRGVAREQATLFIQKLKAECNNLKDIEQEIQDSIYFVQGY
jgi:hypothetical protein